MDLWRQTSSNYLFKRLRREYLQEMLTLSNHKKRLLISLFCIAFVLTTEGYAAPSSTKGQKVVAWSYYVFPPFIVDGYQGLTRDFISLLNEKADGRFTFHLDVLPRKRIDLFLDENEPGIVLFVNPSWMGYRAKALYRWTPPLFSDKNVIISNVSKKVDFTGPESIADLKLGGVFGRKYKGLDKFVANRKILREDAKDEELNVLKLSERRIDFMTAPETTLRYLVAHLGMEDRIYFSPIPLFEYTRHILISNASPELSEFIIQFVNELPENPKWIKLKKQYRLQ